MLERIEIRTSTKTTTVYHAPGYPIKPNRNWFRALLDLQCFMAPRPQPDLFYRIINWTRTDMPRRLSDEAMGIARIDGQPIISFSDSAGFYRDSQVRHRVWRELLEKKRSLKSAKQGV